MSISRFLIAATVAAAALGCGAPEAGAGPTFQGSLVLVPQVSNTTLDLTTVSDFVFTSDYWGSEGGSFTELGAANSLTALTTTDLNLHNITSFQISGAALSATGKSFGTFDATSFTTSVSTPTSVTYFVYGNYSESFAAEPLSPATPNAEITIGFTIPSNTGSCGAGCVVSVSATMSSPPTDAVPEPATATLLVSGLFGLGAVRRRQRAGR